MPKRPYGLLCALSHACEVLEPRWTLPILNEMWCGSTRFNDIRRGVGNISSALLSKRLKELEAAGLIERIEDRAAGSVQYIRTERAIKLEPAMHALAEWAQCNIDADLALRHTDVSTLMWHMRRRFSPQDLPNRRVVMRFRFRDDPPPAFPVYWLLAEPGSIPELCTHDRGFDIDLFVETSSVSLGAIIMGRSTIDREVAEGGLFLSGDAVLSRTMHRWLKNSMYSTLASIEVLRSDPEAANRTAA